MQEHQLSNNCTENNYFPHFHNKPLHVGSAHLLTLCCLHFEETPQKDSPKAQASEARVTLALWTTHQLLEQAAASEERGEAGVA